MNNVSSPFPEVEGLERTERTDSTILGITFGMIDKGMIRETLDDERDLGPIARGGRREVWTGTRGGDLFGGDIDGVESIRASELCFSDSCIVGSCICSGSLN